MLCRVGCKALQVLLAFLYALAVSFLTAPFAAADPEGAGKVTVEERRGSPPPCTVSVRLESLPLTLSGMPRNNPDGTYYPGDAFSATMSVRSLHCTSISTMLSGSQDISLACPTCRSSRADISPLASYGMHTVRALAFGTGPGGSGSASADLYLVVADPMITVQVVPADVKDSDGYLMRNADDTHYVNDAIALRYEVNYRFKDDRRGVIEPEVGRTSPYPGIADLDCLQEYCTFVVPATLYTSEYKGHFTYATGISVVNATSLQDLGPKVFQFDITLKNAGMHTAMKKAHSHTVAVVNYAPVFAPAYPYLDLSDGGSRSYEKKLIVGLHYLGSSEQDGTIKPLRRAKLNWHTNDVSALTVGTDSTDISEVSGLVWLYTSSFSDARRGSVVVQTQQGISAVIERAGYAKVVMEMERYEPEVFTRIKDVTASMVFYSKDFAGIDLSRLFEAEYVYPDTYFANTLTVQVTDGNSVQSEIPIEIELWPAAGAVATVCEYYGKRALYVTGDAMFSAMALSDTYPCSAFHKRGSGAVEIRLNMTGIIVPKIHDMMYPDGLEAMPTSVALSLPSSLALHVSMPETGRMATHHLDLYSHSMNSQITVNVGQNNALEATRKGASVTVKTPSNFGAITSLYVNGIAVKDVCQDMCILDIPHAAVIAVTNEWGGKAIADVPAPEKMTSHVAHVPVALVQDDGQTFVLALFGAAGAAMTGVVFKKYIAWLGDAFY